MIDRMTEGDMAYVVMKTDEVDGRTIQVPIGVSDRRAPAEKWVEKAEKSRPKGIDYPSWRVEEVLVL